ncbi:F-box only protein 31 [Trebouxia sp. C0009 RCD-2024]
MALLEVSGDGLRAILQHLPPKNLCICKLVCRKLKALASEDTLWEAQCHRWFQRHGQQSGLCNVAPSRLRSQLHHASYASMYQVLHSLGGWPEGYWYRTGLSAQPHGDLVWIGLRGAVLHVVQLDHDGLQTATFCKILLNTLPVQIVLRTLPAHGRVLHANAIHINSSAGTMLLRPESNRDGDVTRPTDVAQRYERWPPGDPGLYEDSQELLRLHRVSPLPSVLPHPGAPVMPDLQPGFTAAQALQRVVGLWTAFYGDHGPEILHVWFDETLQSHNGAPVFEGRNARPRLVGCKVTGDPNVPATQWSFVAQAGEMKLGPWDGRGSWTNDSEDLQNRLIVTMRGLPALVNMSDRQVVARFLCHGCINRTPGNFQPEWVPAQLLLYKGPQAMFSVLFDDMDERYRHMMDFKLVPLPGKSALSWLQE